MAVFHVNDVSCFACQGFDYLETGMMLAVLHVKDLII